MGRLLSGAEPSERARERVGKAGGADPGEFGGPEDEAVWWALAEGLGLGTARLPTGPLGGGAELGTWEGVGKQSNCLRFVFK